MIEVMGGRGRFLSGGGLWRKENEVGHQGFSVFRSSKNASQQESETGHCSINSNCS